MNIIKALVLATFTFFTTQNQIAIQASSGTNISSIIACANRVEPTIPVDTSVTPEITSDTLYLEIIEHIKKYESFRGSIYIDTDGSPTIGYGHHLREGESFPDTITEKHATQILIDDFDRRVALVEEQHGLSGGRAYAIALFVYNCGSGTYAKSSLKIAVDNNAPIDDIIVMYCKFKQNGVYHTNVKLLERRKFELKIYNA